MSENYSGANILDNSGPRETWEMIVASGNPVIVRQLHRIGRGGSVLARQCTSHAGVYVHSVDTFERHGLLVKVSSVDGVDTYEPKGKHMSDLPDQLNLPGAPYADGVLTRTPAVVPAQAILASLERRIRELEASLARKRIFPRCTNCGEQGAESSPAESEVWGIEHAKVCAKSPRRALEALLRRVALEAGMLSPSLKADIAKALGDAW